MDLHLRLDGRHDLTGQIYTQLRLAVLEGRLQAGEQVPPSPRTRPPAERVTDNGHHRLRPADRRGLPHRHARRRHVRDQDVRPVDPSAMPASAVRAQPAWDEVALPSAFDEPAELDLRSGLPDLARFPYESWRRLLAHEHRLGGASSEPYGHPAGNLALREAIARHLATSPRRRDDGRRHRHDPRASAGSRRRGPAPCWRRAPPWPWRTQGTDHPACCCARSVTTSSASRSTTRVSSSRLCPTTPRSPTSPRPTSTHSG